MRAWLEGWRLDVAFTLLTLWLVAGSTWDFHVHASGLDFEEEGFITHPHITLYGAFIAIAGLLAAATYLRRRRGYSWAEAVPPGYRVGILGVVVFAIGGPADWAWHSVFGAEQWIEGLTSPTHLLLAIGSVLFVSSPLRAAWFRTEERTLLTQLPLLFSAGFVAMTIGTFGMYGNPLTRPIANGSLQPGLVMLNVVAFSVLLVGLTLILVRRFDLAPGAFVILYTIIGSLSALNVDLVFLPAMLVTGVVADVYNRAFRPNPSRILVFRLFAYIQPFVLFVGYFLIHRRYWEIALSIHLQTGAVVISGLVGILVSYLVEPYGGGRSR